MEWNRRLSSLALWVFGFNLLVFVDNSGGTIPLSLLKKVQHLDTKDFLKNYVKPNPVRPDPGFPGNQPVYGVRPILGPGGPQHPSDGFDRPDESSLWDTQTGSLTEQGADTVVASIGDPTGCQPEEASVAVSEQHDPNIMYWPSCKRVPRCSGCCNSDLMECAAIRVTVDETQVARLRYEPGRADFILEDFEMISLERHLECSCRCKVQPNHCNDAIQDYLEHSCQCRCRNDHMKDSCPEHQVWDSEHCKCTCPRMYGCFEDEYFSNTTCRCEQRVRGGGGQLSSPDADLNPCLTADPPVRCRPGMAPVPFGDQCECRIASNWGDDLAALPVGNVRPTTRHHTWERVPGHPQYHEVTDPTTLGPARPTRPVRPTRRPHRRPSRPRSKFESMVPTN